jgi:hypothetical protein
MLVEPLYNPIVKRIFTDEESKEILEFMKEKVYVYHRASESKLMPCCACLKCHLLCARSCLYLVVCAYTDNACHKQDD